MIKMNTEKIELIDEIVCGDSLQILQKLPNESIDLIVTSPPYNIGMEYDKYNDRKEWNYYFSFLKAVWKECYRILRKGGRICINIQPAFLHLTPTHYTIGNQLIEMGFKWFHEIIWDKNYSRKKTDGWDYWQRTRTPFFKVSWEYIQIFFKEPLKKEGKVTNIDVTNEEFSKWINAKWQIVPELNMKSYGHPAMFPEEIPKRLIKLLSNPDDVVLDPFCGAGTTTLAAKKNNRKFIGIDLSEKYCKIAKTRLKRAYNSVVRACR